MSTLKVNSFGLQIKSYLPLIMQFFSSFNNINFKDFITENSNSRNLAPKHNLLLLGQYMHIGLHSLPKNNLLIEIKLS